MALTTFCQSDAAPFLLAQGLLAIACLMYAPSYLAGISRRRLVLHLGWFLVANLGLSGVFLASTPVRLLVAWEAMSLSGFFLISQACEQPKVREASWIYLVASQFGALCLMLWAAGASLLPPPVLALLGITGFGLKAGLVPLHGWLPEAHAAAPSHVSAFFSGSLVTAGLWGLRWLLEMPGLAASFSWSLLALGTVSALWGALGCLSQREFKRSLAFSTVENMGLMTGMLALAHLFPQVRETALWAFRIHLVAHALLKGLAFLAAGSVLHATGEADMDRLGGLLRRMPWTGTLFLIAAAGLSGLPGTPGFWGPFLFLSALFHAALSIPASGTALSLLGIAALVGLVEGLALAAFVRMMGFVFLGTPRSAAAEQAHESARPLKTAMAFLAACLALFLLVYLLPFAISALPREASFLGSGLVLLTVLLWLLRRRLLAVRETSSGPTWDCGYHAPTARMQYTATSFAQPLTSLFRMVRRDQEHEGDLFLVRQRIETQARDAFREKVFHPAWTLLRGRLSALRFLQSGQAQAYVLYIALTLVGLLLWKL
jgi:hydrogenase-4 component B